nr:MAG TPA: peroxin [Caudoviricetes sp.]
MPDIMIFAGLLAGTLVLAFGVPYIMYRIWIIRMRKQILRRMEVENAEMRERLSRDFPVD